MEIFATQVVFISGEEKYIDSRTPLSFKTSMKVANLGKTLWNKDTSADLLFGCGLEPSLGLWDDYPYDPLW